MYYAACYDYFVDLSEIESDLRRQGHFGAKNDVEPVVGEEGIDRAAIEAVEIPPGRYFLPFTMCLLSLKSYRTQFLAVLDALYKTQAGDFGDNEQARDGRTVE